MEIAKQNMYLKIDETKASINSNWLPVVNVDRNQMIQLFQNLISNSIKFSMEEPRIYISAKSEQGFNIISVRDEGIGIDPVYSERIFKIFQRLHQKSKYEGTGVGLAICKRIVERIMSRLVTWLTPGILISNLELGCAEIRVSR